MKNARWFQTTRGFRDRVLVDYPVFILSVAYVGLTLAWWPSLEESPLMRKDWTRGIEGEGGADNGRDGGDGELRGVAGSSKDSDKKVNGKNAIVTALRALAQPANVALYAFICAVARSVELEHGRSLVCHKREAETHEWFVAMATMQRRQHWCWVLNCLYDEKLLVSMGLGHVEETVPGCQLPGETAKELVWDMVRLVCKTLLGAFLPLKAFGSYQV